MRQQLNSFVQRLDVHSFQKLTEQRLIEFTVEKILIKT